MQSPGPETRFQPEIKYYAIAVYGDNSDLVVGILRDGSVEYGKGFTSDTAAKVFWDRVGLLISLDK